MNDFYDKILYNTKVKRYRDGSYTVTYCNSRIFVNKEEQEEYFKTLVPDELEKADNSDNSENTKVKDILDKYENSKTKSNEKRKAERTDHMKEAIDKIYDLALQNDWSYFLTITIDPEQFNSKDVKEVYKKLSNWLREKVRHKGLQYLLIPEYHQNGGIHAHALINDCFNLEHSGRYLYQGKAYKESTLKSKGIDISNLKPVYNVPEWKYGYSTAIPVDGTPARLANYITKYITKDCKKIFGKYYLSSRNLKRDTEIQLCNSEKFDDLKGTALCHGGMSFKYVSDFRMSSEDDRDTSDDILTYLSERGLL